MPSPFEPSPFETSAAAPAIPITFASKSNWDAIRAELPAQARQFADANLASDVEAGSRPSTLGRRGFGQPLVDAG